MLVFGFHFSASWPRGDSASPAVEAHAIHRHVANDRPIHVGVVNHLGVNVHYGRVVREHSVIPASADEADSAIAKSIINSAVESDVRSPISRMPEIAAGAPAPVTGRPEQSNLGRLDPSTRHPVITIRAIRPISRRPEISRRWANRLIVHGQCWRPDMDRNPHADLRGRNSRQSKNC